MTGRWPVCREVGYIVLVGIGVRLLLLLIVDPALQAFAGDARYYVDGAHKLWAGHLPGNFRAPLYSFFLALTLPFGWTFALLVQSSLSISGGVGAFYTLKGRGGFIAGMLIAGCPFLALYDFQLISETLYIQLAWFGILAVCLRRWVAAGLLLGLAVLARDSLALLPLLVSAYLLAKRNWKGALLPIVAYAVLLPWIAVTGSLSQGRAGLNLWLGTWERNGKWTSAGFEHPIFPAYAFKNADEKTLVEKAWLRDDHALLQLAIDRIKADPLGTLLVWAKRYPSLWIGTRSDQFAFRLTRGALEWKASKGFLFGLNACLLLFGIWGAARADGFRVLLLPIFYVSIVYIPFHTENRFSLLALPSLLALGSKRLEKSRPMKSATAPALR